MHFDGVARVDMAHSTWFMFDGSTSSSTAMIHFVK